jgi:hypothetical protein
MSAIAAVSDDAASGAGAPWANTALLLHAATMSIRDIAPTRVPSRTLRLLLPMSIYS